MPTINYKTRYQAVGVHQPWYKLLNCSQSEPKTNHWEHVLDSLCFRTQVRTSPRVVELARSVRWWRVVFYHTWSSYPSRRTHLPKVNHSRLQEFDHKAHPGPLYQFHQMYKTHSEALIRFKNNHLQREVESHPGIRGQCRLYPRQRKLALNLKVKMNHLIEWQMHA